MYAHLDDFYMQEEEVTEDEMAGWHHRLNAHEFEEAPGVGKPGVLPSTGS